MSQGQGLGIRCQVINREQSQAGSGDGSTGMFEDGVQGWSGDQEAGRSRLAQTCWLGKASRSTSWAVLASQKPKAGAAAQAGLPRRVPDSILILSQGTSVEKLPELLQVGSWLLS